jgi:hypothetical protein
MTITLQTLLALATILLSSVIHSFTTPYTSSLIRPPLSSPSQQAPSTCSSRKTTVPSKSGLCMSSETEVEDIVATVEVEDEGKILVCFSSFDECTSYVRCVVVGRIQKEVYNDLWFTRISIITQFERWFFSGIHLTDAEVLHKLYVRGARSHSRDHVSVDLFPLYSLLTNSLDRMPPNTHKQP